MSADSITAPCPWCGGPAAVEYWGRATTFAAIECRHCYARGPSLVANEKPSVEDLRLAWNALAHKVELGKTALEVISDTLNDLAQKEAS